MLSARASGTRCTLSGATSVDVAGILAGVSTERCTVGCTGGALVTDGVGALSERASGVRCTRSGATDGAAGVTAGLSTERCTVGCSGVEVVTVGVGALSARLSGVRCTLSGATGFDVVGGAAGVSTVR